MEEEPPADCTGGDGPGPPEYCVSTEPFLHHPAGDPRGEDTGGTTQQTGPAARGHAGGWTGNPVQSVIYVFTKLRVLNYSRKLVHLKVGKCKLYQKSILKYKLGIILKFL